MQYTYTQSLKHFLQVLSGMSFSSFHEFCLMASMESKRVPRSGNFSFRNRKKSHVARSDEYGG